MTTIDDVFANITSEVSKNKVTEVVRNIFTAVKFQEPFGLEEADTLTKAITAYVDETIELLPEESHKSAGSGAYISVDYIPASRRNWLAGYQGFVANVTIEPDHPKYVEAQKVLDHIEQIANHFRD